MRRLIIVCLLLCCVAFVVLRRWIQVYPYPVGAGQSAKSPDGRYEASVLLMQDEKFFGSGRSWYEFRISGGKAQRLTTDRIPGPGFNPRSTNTVIIWSEDSSVARFVFPEVEIRLKP